MTLIVLMRFRAVRYPQIETEIRKFTDRKSCKIKYEWIL